MISPGFGTAKGKVYCKEVNMTASLAYTDYFQELTLISIKAERIAEKEHIQQTPISDFISKS
jgi:hypothetical protein